MAIALDAASTISAQAATTSLTFSHTCTGANRILFVYAGNQQGTPSITGVTYNGVAMTFIARTDSQSNERTELWYLVAPATGANNVVISVSGSSKIAGGAISYTGAAQTGQPDSSNVSPSPTSGTSVTVSTTVVASGCWLVGCGVTGNATIAAGTGMTQRANRAGDGSFDTTITGDSNGTVGTGSQSLQITNGASDSIGLVVASFAPVAAAATALPYRALMGVGI